jgi:hypothetical protein
MVVNYLQGNNALRAVWNTQFRITTRSTRVCLNSLVNSGAILVLLWYSGCACQELQRYAVHDSFWQHEVASRLGALCFRECSLTSNSTCITLTKGCFNNPARSFLIPKYSIMVLSSPESGAVLLTHAHSEAHLLPASRPDGTAAEMNASWLQLRCYEEGSQLEGMPVWWISMTEGSQLIKPSSQLVFIHLDMPVSVSTTFADFRRHLSTSISDTPRSTGDISAPQYVQ